jgi:hypothetical protein
VRLRVIVPGRRRRAGLGGLVALLFLAGCGGGERPKPEPKPAPVPRFAIGIDEKNPHLLAPGDQPAQFARFRDALVALKPTYVRVLVDWSTVQKSADAPPVFDELKDGCARGAPPCAPYHGIHDTLRAVRKLGATPVLLIYGTPDWAASPAEGCERDGVTPYARTPRIEPYRVLVRALLAEARAAGFDDPYLSPWNEPNTPIFLNPQRAGCAAGDRPLAPARYAALARAAAAEVAPGRLLVGETAGITPHTHAVGAAEFAREIPDDVVCRAAAYTQHLYVTAPRDRGARVDPVPRQHNAVVLEAVERAMDRCGRPIPIWITETGAGNRAKACSAMGQHLRMWQNDPRVAAAFQYTLRDDPIFPVGLADAGLTRLYPAYEAWRTRGARC